MNNYYILKFICVFFLIALTGLISEVSAQSYSGGSGTVMDPYLISNKTDLEYLSENSGEWGKHFKQTADLTFVDADFQVGGNFYNGGSFFIPIGNLTIKFTGSYDGNNKKISNLKFNAGATFYVGFFGYTTNTSQIKNLTLLNEQVYVFSGQYTGGLVAWNEGSITDCYVDAVIDAATNVGVLVGNNRGPILRCYVTGSVNAGNRVGGLVGVLGSGGSISNSFSRASVSDRAVQNLYGGLVGDCSGNITNCYATGLVDVPNSFRGGLIGRRITGTVSNCYWDTITTGLSTSDGGTGKNTTQMNTQSTFNTWDFTNVWGINGSINSGYPYLLNNVPPVLAPTTQAFNLVFSDVQNVNFTVNWTNGNGSARAVFVKQTNTGTSSPTNNTTYTANSIFGSGSQIGVSGWYCVYNGTGTNVTVTNLSPGTEYRVMVCEYNGGAGSEVYNISSATNNPRNQTTLNTFPVVTSSAATNILSSSADLNGSVNPNGLATDGYFEWGTDNTLTTFSTTSTQSVGSGTSAVNISANLTGLTPNTTYYFRAVGINLSATVKGSILNFTTPAALPTVTTIAATNITVSSGTLNGTVNPNLGATDGYFEWGTDNTLTTYSTTAVQPLGSGNTPVDISENLSGLLSGTTYYFRAVGSNSAGITKGSILSFTTNIPGLSQWEPFETLFLHSLYSISFVDGNPSTGFAAGEQGTILKTTNYGINWTTVLSVPGKWFNSVQMFNSNVIYGVGTYGMIYKSVDGGNTWIDQSISGSDKHFRSVYVVSATESYAVGFAGTFYSTTDGGATPWIQNSQIPWTMFSISMSPNFSVSGNGIIAATDGYLYRRTGFSGTWNHINIRQTLGVYDYLNSVVWLDNNNAIVVGNNGRILKTSNAGASWTIKTSPTGNHLRAVEAISFGAGEFVVIAVGDNGTIIRSHGFAGTVGNSWTVESSNTTKHLYGVSLPSLAYGFTIGEKGQGDSPPGPASYVNHNLTISTTSLTQINNVIPERFELKQNYPNPFNPITKIDFSVPKNEFVTIKIYDVSGREIFTLLNETKAAGNYSVSFNSQNLSSGIYFYTMRTNGFVQTRRMVLMK